MQHKRSIKRARHFHLPHSFFFSFEYVRMHFCYSCSSFVSRIFCKFHSVDEFRSTQQFITLRHMDRNTHTHTQKEWHRRTEDRQTMAETVREREGERTFHTRKPILKYPLKCYCHAIYICTYILFCSVFLYFNFNEIHHSFERVYASML